MNPVIDLSRLEKALQSLENSLVPPPANDRERDGAIQRFEYTFELSWKSAKKVLERHGILTQSPRNIIRELAQKGWISRPEKWFEFLEARNEASHTYREEVAQEVFKKTKEFLLEGKNLLNVLKQKQNE